MKNKTANSSSNYIIYFEVKYKLRMFKTEFYKLSKN